MLRPDRLFRTQRHASDYGDDVGVRGQRQAAVIGLVVALGAVALSVLRLLVQSGNSIGELVWAEDGLFPLCIRKSGMWECLSDPFAGYLLGVPRLLAGITAATPLDSWGWTTNVVAGITWGALAGIAAYWLLAAGIRLLPAIVVALLPVIAPITGLEAVNSIGSMYMPLLYSATVALAVGWTGRVQTVIAGGLVFLAAATIPTAMLLVGVLGFSVVRKRISRRSGVVVLIALILGGVAQFAVVLTAEVRRNTAFSGEAIGFWLNDLPTALLTTWPGLNFGSTTIFGIFTLPAVPWTGAFLAIALLVSGIVLSLRKAELKSVAGLLIVTGLAYSFIPTATGYASNRYFVLTVTSVLAATVLLLDSAFSETRQWSFRAVIVVFAVAWIAAFPASTWRAVPAPPWQEVIDQAEAQCVSDSMAPVRLTFSPGWPQDGVTELQPPTNQFAPCSALRLSTEG